MVKGLKKKLRDLLVLFLLALVIGKPALAEELHGKVVAITDGDTLKILTEEMTQIKIRLSDIDTPERKQPYGDKAKELLSALSFGKQAHVHVIDIDRYGRTVGRVYADGIDVNSEMVKRGAAWVYRRYSHDPKLLILEQAAREKRLGLWGLPEVERLAPWEWRKLN